MLFCTSLLALVGAADQPESSPRKLQIVNTKRQSMICELLFPSSILAVKMNRKTLVIVLAAEIYIYNISNMRLRQPTTPTQSAPSLPPPTTRTSPTPPHSPPRPRSPPPTGDVLLFSTRSLTVANVVRAHKSPISLLSLNSTGTLLTTASDKGTVIRVWSVPAAEKLCQFRRGTREARIYSLNFNSMSTLLAVSSAHDTVHIFKLGPQRPQSQSQSPSQPASPPTESDSIDSRDTGYDTFIDKKPALSVSSSLRRKSIQVTKSLTHSVGGYLPTTLTELWEPSRDFAFLRLPVHGARFCIVALSPTTPHVMVVSSEGYFYSYSIDLEIG